MRASGAPKTDEVQGSVGGPTELAGKLAAEDATHSDRIFQLLVQSVKDYAIFLLDPEGRVSSWNAGAERIKGYSIDDILGQHFSIFYPPDAIAARKPYQELKIAIREGRFEEEGWRIRKDGSRFWASVTITPLYRDGILQGFAKVTRDLSEHKATEMRLRASEEKSRLLVSGIKDYAIFMLDPDGHVVTWNAGAQAINGYAADEILGKHFSVFYPKEAKTDDRPARELQIATAQGSFVNETWGVRKDGSRFWASIVLTALRDGSGHLYGFSKVTHDMSERRKRDEQIEKLNTELRSKIDQLDESRRAVELHSVELQKLSAELLRVQDEERRRVARELHDELGQELAGLKMLLEARSDKPLEKNARSEAVALAERAIQSVRNLSYLLHPPLLDEAGLFAALRWYVDGLAQRSGIKIDLETAGLGFQRLPIEIETTVFRIVQESLTNVYRHSGSNQARVEIEKHSDSIVVRVRDYGKGLPAHVAKGLSKSFGVGIGGMRERVKQFGGTLIISQAEPGAQVEATIPLLEKEQAA
ncbi:MAG: histidine kinase [Acidobacteria bacterium]|nr:MAG: histidine kinase [Acidobacteriota bacterium]PYX28494.1 MAG: histidine kinase [Acidobacteriota bacterium]